MRSLLLSRGVWCSQEKVCTEPKVEVLLTITHPPWAYGRTLILEAVLLCGEGEESSHSLVMQIVSSKNKLHMGVGKGEKTRFRCALVCEKPFSCLMSRLNHAVLVGKQVGAALKCWAGGTSPR